MNLQTVCEIPHINAKDLPSISTVSSSPRSLFTLRVSVVLEIKHAL